MRILISTSFLFLSLTIGAITAEERKAANNSGSLIVIIDGFVNDKGNAMIALCDSEESYKNSAKTFNMAAAPIKDGKAEWTFDKIPFGTYAVKVYHDENNNMKLDTGAFGIPTEFYGFSNNARGTFGPPKYKEAKFTFEKINMTIRITIK